MNIVNRKFVIEIIKIVFIILIIRNFNSFDDFYDLKKVIGLLLLLLGLWCFAAIEIKFCLKDNQAHNKRKEDKYDLDDL